MKKALLFLLAVAAVGLLSFRFSHVDNFTADASASKIEWTGYKVTGKHNGLVALKNGSLQIDHGTFKGGSFEIDMNSITCLDLEGEWAGKLVGHLKSPDFFDAAGFPTAKVAITRAIPQDTKGNYKFFANLTIKGKTQEVKFFGNVSEKDGMATASGKLTIDRSLYDVKFGSGSFFDGLGDKTIYDEFDVAFTIVGKK